MKKLFSLLLVVAMMASLSLVAFAADANVLSTEIVETDSGIVATVYITNPTQLYTLTAGYTIPTTLTSDKSYTLAETFSDAKVTPGYKEGAVKFAISYSDATHRINKEGKVEVLSFTLTRKDENATYTSADFSIPNTGLYVSKVNVDGTEFTSKNTMDYFTAPVYTDNRKPATVDKWETSAAPEGWTAPKAKDAEGNDVDGVRSVVVFGKNATAKVLGAEEYGVKFGANKYYGGATTDAVKYWAIVLVDTEGDMITAGTTYTGTAFVGQTEWPVTVSAN